MAKGQKQRSSTPYISQSKTRAPTLSPGELERSVLVDELSSSSTRKLTVLQAPAGYGKSTTMRQLMARFQTGEFLTMWLNLDEGDNDLSRFLSAWRQAVAPVADQFSDEDYLQLSDEELAHLIIDGCMNVINPTVVFIDNMEVIKNPAVLGVIARGIAALPENCRIFIGTRTTPDIGLVRLAARGDLRQIDADALRFSQEETHNLLVPNGAVAEALNEQQIQHLFRSTGGWAAALKLAMFALEGKPNADQVISSFSGTDAAVAAYLAEEVLTSLSPSMQEFLLQSSIFDEIDVGICNEVLDRADSQAMLEELQQRNLFINVSDENKNLYRYHSLFRDFLQNQSHRLHPQQVAQLQQRAGQAYLQQGRIVPAIRHSLKSGDSSVALELLEENVDALLAQGRIGLLTNLLAQLTESVLNKHLHLKLIYALCATYTRGPQQAYELLREMDEETLPSRQKAYLLALRPMQLGMMDRIEEAHTQGTAAFSELSSDNPNARIILSQTLTQTSIILGEHARAREFSDQSRSDQGEKVDIFNLLLTEAAESSIDLMTGHLKQASSRIKLAMTRQPDQDNSRNGGRGRGVTMASIQLAEILYERDDCSTALPLLTTNSALVQDMGPPDALITASIIQSRIVDSEGDYEHSLQLLLELESSGRRLKLPRVVASARLERSRLWLAHGDFRGSLEQLELAQRTYDWEQTENLWFAANDTLTPEIVNLRWLIRKGTADKALPMARKQLKVAERSQRVRRALKLRILLAEALFVSGDHNSARRTMSQAVEFAEQEGFIRTFLEEGPTLVPLFKDMGIDRPPYQQLKKGAPSSDNKSATSFSPQQAIAAMPEEDRLTNKEMQILSVLAMGLSNMAMAEKLFVSESTVRTHLRNINLKLHAKNRTEAVTLARNLGLIA